MYVTISHGTVITNTTITRFTHIGSVTSRVIPMCPLCKSRYLANLCHLYVNLRLSCVIKWSDYPWIKELLWECSDVYCPEQNRRRQFIKFHRTLCRSLLNPILTGRFLMKIILRLLFRCNLVFRSRTNKLNLAKLPIPTRDDNNHVSALPSKIRTSQ